MNSKKIRLWLPAIILVTLVTGSLVAIAFSPLHKFLTSPDDLRTSVKALGWKGPLIIIAIHTAQIVIAPIPGQAIDIANGYLFGWWGGLVSMAGIALGSTLAIALAKRWGRPLVEQFMTPPGLVSVRRYIRGRNQWLFFFLFLLPGTPDDILCYAIGLSSIPFGRAVLIAILGRAPGVLAAVAFGVTGQGLSTIIFLLTATMVTLAVNLLVRHWRPVRQWVIRVGRRG